MSIHNLVIWQGFQIYPNNIPQEKPGVYGLFNLISKKWYVGAGQDLQYRVLDYTSPTKNQGSIATKLYYALQKYPLSSFILVPLYYQLGYNRKELLGVEARLILAYDSVKNGYNIIESQEGGFEYGEEFRRLCLEGWRYGRLLPKHNKFC